MSSINRDLELAREAELSIMARIHRLANELQDEDPRLTFAMCIARAWQSQAQLYRQFQAARRVLAAAGIKPIVKAGARR